MATKVKILTLWPFSTRISGTLISVCSSLAGQKREFRRKEGFNNWGRKEIEDTPSRKEPNHEIIIARQA